MLNCAARTAAASSNDLNNVDGEDLSWIEIDAAFEGPAEAAAIERDDPAFFHDHLFDDASADELRPQYSGILSPRYPMRDQEFAPLIRQHLGEAIARGRFRMHDRVIGSAELASEFPSD